MARRWSWDWQQQQQQGGVDGIFGKVWWGGLLFVCDDGSHSAETQFKKDAVAKLKVSPVRVSSIYNRRSLWTQDVRQMVLYIYSLGGNVATEVSRLD